MKTFQACNDNKVLNEILDLLAENQFYREFNIDEHKPIDEGKLRKAAWFASILAMSNDETMQTKALSFAILTLLEKEDDSLFLNYSYIIISRTGNLPLSVHLKKVIDENIDKFNVYFDDALNLEIGLKRALLRIEVADRTFYGSSFQKRLWDHLNNKKHIAISAPTSSGKSFMVQNYIVDNMIKKDRFYSVYIVPSRALIYEVSSIFRNRLKDYNVTIKTSFSQGKEEFKNKEIFVLTPERALKIIELNREQGFEPDIIFFDEVQNMEQAERGVLFEFVLYELALSCKGTKIVIAGPFLKNLTRTFETITGKPSESLSSMFLSVYQTKAVLRFRKQYRNTVEVFIKSPSGNSIRIDIPFDLTLYSKIIRNKPEAISSLVAKYSPNSQNVIYANTKFSAEIWAIHLSNKLENIGEVDNSITELIEYLSEEIHPNYALIKCLKKRVAFHHSCVPEFARMEIEELYRSGAIRHIVCTPTLIEGVNLPVQKLFMITKKKDKQELANFEFGNLIGRAGRIRSHLSGSVYCIETEDDMWGNEKFESDFTKEIIPVTTKAFQEYKDNLMDDILKPVTKIEKKAVAYTIILLRHKYIKHTGGIYNYLKYKGLPEDEIRYILGKLHDSLKELEIPKEILYINPTIDPLLQNALYLQIMEEKIEKWLISKHPFNTGSKDDSSEEQRLMPFYNKNFYFQFEDLTERLEEIFQIIKEEEIAGKKFKRISIRQIVRYAVPWLQGKPYKKIIERDITIDKESHKSVDTAIRKVTHNINQYVRFEIVKYYKLWADILSYMMDDKEKEKNKYYLNIPQMLEMGACDPRALELMNGGLNRSIASIILGKLPSKIEGTVSNWLQKNSITLPNIFKRHLKNSGF